MITFEEFRKKALANSEVKKEYENLKPIFKIKKQKGKTMKFGDMFRFATGKEPSELTLISIEKEVIKNPKYKKYRRNLVLPKTIFEHKSIDLIKI